MSDHRFPLPWMTKEITGGYMVIDAKGTSLAHFYIRKGQVEREDARLMALNFCRVPAMLGAISQPGAGAPDTAELAWWNGSLAAR